MAKSSKNDAAAETKTEITIEEGIKEIEEILEKMEDGIALEESFKLYEKGINLLKGVNEQIDAVEKKVLKLSEMGELEEFK